MKSELETQQPRKLFHYHIFDKKTASNTPWLFGLSLCCWVLPVVMSKHGAVTVAEVQTPDLHVSISGASGDKCVILV